jgi:hypothetical protein
MAINTPQKAEGTGRDLQSGESQKYEKKYRSSAKI